RQAVLREGLEIVEDGQLDVDWVLAGLDRTFDYEKLTLATRSIRAGARFVATNADALLPIEGGEVLPGAGSIVAAIQAATAVEPIVVGKPEPGLFEDGLRRLGGLQPHQVVMIGDRLETDIAGGRRAGLHTILVLSGVARAQRAQRAERAQDVAGLPPRERSEQSAQREQSAQPDAIAADLASVAALLGWR
ncbi:MAG: HAD hydrolase-like protein, partial [Chloroflexi bacterium]|nr:HAD hydrolase-like protein [Chloroflexota bacterium]